MPSCTCTPSASREESEAHSQQATREARSVRHARRMASRVGPERAETVAGVQAQHREVVEQKYAPWKQLLDFAVMFRKRERTVFVIRAN